MKTTGFAKTLKKELDDRGWKPEDLAEVTQIHLSTIKGWLYEGTEPGVIKGYKVAKALGKTVEEILKDAGYVAHEDRVAYDFEGTPEQLIDDMKVSLHRLERRLREKQQREREEGE